MTAIASAYVSSLSLTAPLRQTVQRLQGDLTRAQTELASGKLADPGHSLGARSAGIAAISAHQASLSTLIDTNGIVSTRLEASQLALKGASDGGQDFVSVLIAQRGTAAPEAIARQRAVDSLQSLTSLLNTSIDGEYVFGGTNGGIAPVPEYPGSPPGAAKISFDTAFQARFGILPNDPAAASIPSTDIGSFIDNEYSALFDPASFKGIFSNAADEPTAARISESETVTTGASANAPGLRSLFKAYVLVAELGGGNLSRDGFDVVLQKATGFAAAATTDVSFLQGALGLDQQRVSAASTRLAAQQDLLKTSLGTLQDVDTYAADAKVSTLTTQIEAAYSLTSKIHGLSLLNYL